MEQWLEHVVPHLSGPALFLLIVLTLYTLGKGADVVVKEAVILSMMWGVPRVLIGATIVSLGTTMPETAVSVLAAIQGNPELALGNAVGSIICDTGLILGLAALISPLPLDRTVVNRQGWLQLGAGCLLVLACVPFGTFGTTLTIGGRLPQLMGVVFLLLLVLYLWQSITWTRNGRRVHKTETVESVQMSHVLPVLLTLLWGIGLVLGSSWVLIPAVREAALRLHVPQSVIAATLVAFGTSLPELVTSITAARQGYGELAVGNVIGADILNVLFVVGASAAVTAGGLSVSPYFFRFLFPAMLCLLVIFRIGIVTSGVVLRRSFGVVLLCAYLIVTVLSYRFDAAP